MDIWIAVIPNFILMIELAAAIGVISHFKAKEA